MTREIKSHSACLFGNDEMRGYVWVEKMNEVWREDIKEVCVSGWLFGCGWEPVYRAVSESGLRMKTNHRRSQRKRQEMPKSSTHTQTPCSFRSRGSSVWVWV